MKLPFSFPHSPVAYKAFTIVETLVATMVLTMTILGPLTVAISAASYARQVKDTITATYLAQESIELLRYQQDSIYIRCVQATSGTCAISYGEAPDEAAWRIFKARLGATAAGPTCFGATCSYDYIDMTASPDTNPPKYASNGGSCARLELNSFRKYVCAPVHTVSGNRVTGFTRTVILESINTFSGTDAQYNDDVRATVTVSFVRSNGTTKQVRIVGFLHARN